MPRLHAHPGEVLNDELLVPLNLSARQLAAEIGVPANRISDLLRGRRAITADTALRLGKLFGTTPMLWLNLQNRHDLFAAELQTDYSSIEQRHLPEAMTVFARQG